MCAEEFLDECSLDEYGMSYGWLFKGITSRGISGWIMLLNIQPDTEHVGYMVE